MKIAELASRAGVAPSAVRWYEQEGVLPAPARTPNGYRAYDDVDLARLRLLLSLRRLGLAPEDAGDSRDSASSAAPSISTSRRSSPGSAGPSSASAPTSTASKASCWTSRATIAAAGRATRRERPMPADPIRVLFVCTHNSARSQIAEALLQRYGGVDFEVSSAGTEVTQVNPYAAAGHRGCRDRLERRPEQVDHRVPGPAVRLRHHGLRSRPGDVPGLPGIDEHAPLGPRRSIRGRGHRRARSWPRSGGPRPRSRRGSARSSRWPFEPRADPGARPSLEGGQPPSRSGPSRSSSSAAARSRTASPRPRWRSPSGWSSR